MTKCAIASPSHFCLETRTVSSKFYIIVSYQGVQLSWSHRENQCPGSFYLEEEGGFFQVTTWKEISFFAF